MPPPLGPSDPASLSGVMREAGMGAWAINVTQGRVEWATEVDAYSGFSESAGSIESILERVHPDDRDELIASIAQPFEDGERYEHRYRIVNPDGSETHLFSRGTARITSDGDTVVTGVSQDVSALVEAGHALARSEARAHFLAEASSDLIGRHDAELRFTSVSHAAEDIVGQPASALIGAGLEAWLHPDDVAAVLGALEAASYRPGTSLTTTSRCAPTAPSAPDCWLETRWRRLPSLDGAWVSSTRDVTEQRRAVAEAERNQERLRRLTRITAQIDIDADEQVRETLHLLVGAFGASAALLAVELGGVLVVDAAAGAQAPATGRALARTEAWLRPAQSGKVWYTPDVAAQAHPAGGFGARSAIDLALRVEGHYRGCVSVWLPAPVALTDADQHFLHLTALWLSALFERADAADRLRSSRDLLQSLLASSLDGVMAFASVRDGEGAVVDFEWLLANPQNERLIGLNPAEMVGKRLGDVLPGNWETGLFDAYVRVVETGEPYETELRYAHDDIDFWVALAAVKLGDGFFVTFRDVSDERRAAEQLRQSEERYRLLAENASDMVCLHDTDGRYLYVSPSAREVIGYAPAEMIGRDPFDFFHPDDAERLRASMAEALSGQPVQIVYRFRRPDGTHEWLESVSQTRVSAASAGEPLRIQTSSRNVTARVAAERDLARLNRTLEQRNKELQDFAYVASHDLQEPLRKIRAFSDLLVQEEAERLSDEGRHFLDRVNRSAGRMSSLINDLLAYSRVATHASPFRRVDLNETLREVLVDLDYALEEADAHVDAGRLPTVEADPMQMRQLLHNLIGNATKFRREGVPLRLRVTGSVSDDCVTLEVADNGIGLDAKYGDRIFDPFQRLHGRDAYPGTGMGLAICRRIAQRHHGDITVSGAPSEGATFRVTLSLAPSSTLEPVP